MKIIKASNFDLLSTNLSLTDGHHNYSSTKTYAKGEYALDPESHKIYLSLKANNTGNPLEELNSEWWEYSSVPNGWRMFDQYLNTYSDGRDKNTSSSNNFSSKNDIVISVDPKGSSSFFIGNMTATSVRVEEIRKSDNVIISDKTFDLYSDIANWKQYFDGKFYGINQKKSFYYHKHNIFEDVKYKITIHNRYAVKDNTYHYLYKQTTAGVFLVGDEVEFGNTLVGESVNLLDYSNVQKEDNGDIFLKKGSFARDISIKVHIHPSIANEFLKAIEDGISEPCVFLPGGNSVTNVYGFIQKTNILLNGQNSAIVSLSLQGLI